MLNSPLKPIIAAQTYRFPSSHKNEFRPEYFLSFSEPTEINSGEKSNRFVCYSIRWPVKGLDEFSCCPKHQVLFWCFSLFLLFSTSGDGENNNCGPRPPCFVIFERPCEADWNAFGELLPTIHCDVTCQLQPSEIWEIATLKEDGLKSSLYKHMIDTFQTKL